MRGRIVIDVADDGGAMVQTATTKGLSLATVKKTVEEQIDEVRNHLVLVNGGGE